MSDTDKERTEPVIVQDDSPQDASESKRMYQKNMSERPFRDEGQVRKAASRFCQRNTRQSQRIKILARLQNSGAIAVAAVPELLGIFGRQDVGTRHNLLEFFTYLAEEGVNLDRFAEDFGKYLSDPNYALRQKVADLLFRMGPGCIGAFARVLGCTRHGLRDVKLLAVKILGVMGSGAEAAGVPRLESMLKAAGTDEELEAAINESIAALKGDGNGATAADDFEIKSKTGVMGVVDNISRPDATQEEIDKAFELINELPSKPRLEGLLRVITNGSVAAKTMAARLLQENVKECIPFAKVITNAYAKETDIYCRGHIADLLCCILCQITLPK